MQTISATATDNYNLVEELVSRILFLANLHVWVDLFDVFLFSSSARPQIDLFCLTSYFLKT